MSYTSNYGYIEYTSGVVFNDIDLDEPSLTSPVNRDKLCKRPFAIAPGFPETDEKVTLTWGAVANATGYVVQLCMNSQFVGPTMKAINVGNVTSYDLELQDDIWYGSTYQWRVFAYNSTGGASPKSPASQFEVICPDSTTNPDDDSDAEGCEANGVTISMTSPGDQVVCLKQMTSYVNVSWTGSCTVSDWVWSVTGPAGILSSGLTYCDLSVGTCMNGTVTLTYELTLVCTIEGVPTTTICRESISFIANGGCGSYNHSMSRNISDFYMNSYGLYLCYQDDITYIDPCGYQYVEYGAINCDYYISAHTCA